MTAEKTKKGPITWLHLSDMHLCKPETGWEADRILDNLKKDFKILQIEHGMRPDLIFFTGDTVFGHMGDKKKSIKDQFEEAGILFEEIRESFSPPISIENFFIVPGNHDVNRSKINELVHDGLNQSLRGDYHTIEKKLSDLIQKKGKKWQDFIDRLSDYRQFLSDFGYTHLLEDPDRLIYALLREINGVTVGIAGLNSAWSSYQPDEKSKLWLAGHWQIQNLSSKLNTAKIKIVLMHHPFNWFNPVEDPRVEREMANHFDFFLHGHEHQEWVEEHARGFTCISAGACYGGNENEMGYNIAQMEVDTGKGKIWLRKYDAIGEGWIPNIIHGRTNNNGTWLLRGKEERESSGYFEDVSVSDPEVEVDMIAEDSPEFRGIFGRGSEIDRIAKTLDKTPIMTIYGMPGVGKTALIKEVCLHPLHNKKGYHRYNISQETGLKELFRQLASTLGCHDENPELNFEMFGKLDFSPLKKYVKHSSPTIIHLDSAHHLFKGETFLNPVIKEFLLVLPDYYPETRFILESRVSPGNIFTEEKHKDHRVYGINCESMALYFRSPFRGKPSLGWDMDQTQKEFVYKWLGGKEKKGRAHPMAMVLLASVADGLNKTPVQILREYEQQEKLIKELEECLFHDLYDKVLNQSEQHMLRLCSLYRDEIPDDHVGILSDRVGGDDAFVSLKRRCLLTPSEGEERYFLHAVIKELTKNRINKDSEEFYLDHEIIANAWLESLARSRHVSLPNIKRTTEAFFHLTESENYGRLNELSDKLIKQNDVLIPTLQDISQYLKRNRRYKDDRHILELLIRVSPKDPRYHRFLGETIEKINGRGNEEALKHYWKAFKLLPTFPAYLNNIGNCLLARDEPEKFVALVDGLDGKTYLEVMNDHNIAIYALCLESSGQKEGASQLRMQQINNNSRHPAFYNDEAKYLLKKGRFQEALDILQKAEKCGCANEYTISIMSSVLEASGKEKEASQLRMQQINNKSRDAAFYNNEAQYLLRKGRFQEALDILQKAEKRGCADEYTISIKSSVLEASGKEREASQLRMQQINNKSGHTAFYTDEAKYLLRKRRFQEALDIIQKAEKRGCTDEYIISIKSSVLERSGKEKEASQLRMQQINNNSRNPAFYNNEAKYLLRKRRFQEALDIIQRVEKQGCANEYTISIKSSVLEVSGEKKEASQLRMQQINNNSLHPAFYTDEANYLSRKGRFQEALDILQKAENCGCADEYIRTMKRKILATAGKSI